MFSLNLFPVTTGINTKEDISSPVRTERIYLPDNFTLPNTVINCKEMFLDCYLLEKLPDNFHIPYNANCENIFHECNKLENKNPKAYMMWEI